MLRNSAIRPTSLLLLSAAILALLIACNATAKAQEDAPTLTLDQKAAYAIGVNLAKQLAVDDLSIDLAYLERGIRDVMDGKELLLDENSMRSAMGELQKAAQQARQAKLSEEAEANVAKGEAFLTQNRGQDGVIETESGLQYKILAAAEGPKPTRSNRVKIHYHGTTLDGVVFDSSVDRGTPSTFGVNQVIPGFSEALMMMSPGAKYRVWIPHTLGYGMNVRAGSKFGPNELLVFEMEMLEILE